MPSVTVVDRWGIFGQFAEVNHRRWSMKLEGPTLWSVIYRRVRSSYPLFLLGDDAKVQKPLEVTVQVDGHQLVMEVDTGASLSLISHATYQQLWPRRPLKASSVNLRTYSGDQVGVLTGWTQR